MSTPVENPAPSPETSEGRDVEIVTFGCRLNAWESEVMRDHARAGGLEDADDILGDLEQALMA